MAAECIFRGNGVLLGSAFSIFPRDIPNTGEYFDTIAEDRSASVPGTETEEAPFRDGDRNNGGRQAGSLLYLKDWHFQRLLREEGTADAAASGTPFFFADDWLNWW